MTHNEERKSWVKEGIAALISGVAFGITSTLIGHPFDTVKTKMQITEIYKGKNLIQSVLHLNKTEGIRGFFRGILPPLIGSSIFRSLQFSVFESVYTYLNKKHYFLNYQIPFTLGLETRVIVAGFTAGLIRSIIECPFEYSKVKLQIGQNWEWKKMFQGFKAQFIRSTGLVTFCLILIDSFRRNTNTYSTNFGIFFVNGFIACLGFLIIWPFEIAKNHIQGLNNKNENPGIYKILNYRVKENGFIKGLFRGILPGLSGIYIRNGFSMMSMVKVQQLLTIYGFRD